MKKEVVVIESAKDRSKLDLLDAALKEVEFPELMEEVRRSNGGKPKDQFLVLIKPNLAMFFKDVVTITDPQLVEYLVDRLHDLGYSNVILGEAQNTFFKWLENREIPGIAKAAGYKFKTPKGREYEFVDLDKEEAMYAFPKAFSLSEVPISNYWVKADFRISFAKNKTHEQYAYTLCLKNLLGTLPRWDKHLHYHSRLKVFDVCLELYRQYPVHFNIIDAYISNHGNAGAQVASPIKTETIIAGADTILVDWVGALKMGLDPHLSPLNDKALDLMGLPDKYQVIGSLDRYKGWRNVHPLICDSFLRLDEAEAVRRFLWPGSFANDKRLFPWKTMRARLVNMIMSPFWARTDRYFVLRWFFIFINYSLVFCYFMKRVLTTLFFKKWVMRKVLPINLPEDEFEDEDYEKLPEALRPLEELAEALPRNSSYCYTFVDDAILYCHERDVDYDFNAFVSKVDICKAVTYMKDYVGGRTIQKTFDNERCINQLERTVFLPQPNLFVLFNGLDVDITKIQKIEYGKDFHKIFWKTVSSDNRSGIYDEGTVIFSRHNFKTRIRIVVHQKFLYPWILRWANVALWPRLRRFIMLRIYRNFFKKTIDNYCAVAQGEYEPMGKPWVKPAN